MNETTERTAPLLVGAKVVARVLGMSETTVYRHVAAGRIPHLKIGATVKFDPEEVAAWLVSGAERTEQ